MKCNYNKFLKDEREKALREEITRVNDEWLMIADYAICYALHNGFGFGEGRLRKFFDMMWDYYTEMESRYRCSGDNSHYLVMQKRLKDSGIDLEKMYEEWKKARE